LHSNRPGCEGEAGRRLEFETVPPTAEPDGRQIGAMAVCQHLPDHFAAGEDVEAHRHFRMLLVLRPAANPPPPDLVDPAA
jgi:hypothetical protein